MSSLSYNNFISTSIILMATISFYCIFATKSKVNQCLTLLPANILISGEVEILLVSLKVLFYFSLASIPADVKPAGRKNINPSLVVHL